MFNGDDAWSYTPSDNDIDDHINALETEEFSNLSEENLRTLVKSFSESLHHRRAHLSLLYNLKDIENKDQLVQDIQNGIQSLEHDVKCLNSELEGRKIIKNTKHDEFIFPKISENDDDTLDLTLLKQLIGNHFNCDDKLTFKSQYNALVHYSKSVALNSKQINQIFTIMLKGPSLEYYTSLDPDLPLKVKIRNLLTVYSYRSSVGDRLHDLETFSRRPFEALDSVYLRLISILESTASLVPPASRVGRSEHILSYAIYNLSLPAARHRLTKFRAEKTLNGQFLTSKELLKAAIRFEEGLTNKGHEPTPLCLKDPFINPGEASKERTPYGSRFMDQVTPTKTEREGIAPDPQPIPQFWENQDRSPYPNQVNNDLKKDIQELSQQVDQLSKAYSKKLNINREDSPRPMVAESHGIEEATIPPTGRPNEKQDHKLDDILESFLLAQYNFYKNFNYSAGPEPRNPSYLRFARWGSNYVKETSPDQYRREYGENRYGRNHPPQNLTPPRHYSFSPQPGGYENARRGYGTMPKNFRSPISNNGRDESRRYPQPKRLRFSEFLKQQRSNTDDELNMESGQQMRFNSGENGGVKAPEGFGKENRTRFVRNQRGEKREREGATDSARSNDTINRASSTNSVGAIPMPNSGFQTLPPN